MRGMSCAIRLHKTDIVIIRPDNTYKLNSGGFRTTTTKRRMNHVLPCVVEQQNGLWSIGDSFFQDGMLVEHDGEIVGDRIPLSDAWKAKRKVDRYCNKFISLVLDMCIIEPIKALQEYKHHRLPNHNNKKHLDDLWWGEILDIVDETKRLERMPSGLYHRLMKWAYLSMIEHGYSNVYQSWGFIRTACELDGDCDIVRRDLLSFMRRRKVNMTQMILDEQKADATFPSLDEAEAILEKELALIS
jgi:hypothetical protein